MTMLRLPICRDANSGDGGSRDRHGDSGVAEDVADDSVVGDAAGPDGDAHAVDVTI